VTSRNQLDSLVHSVQKSLKEYGDKLAADERAKIEAALKDAEEAMKTDDKEKIDAKAQVLSQLAQKLGEKMYAEAQQAQAHRTAATQKHRSRQMRLTSSTPSLTEVKDKKG